MECRPRGEGGLERDTGARIQALKGRRRAAGHKPPTVLTDWPGGGFIGIHGTNAPELLPGRVSHGCIRINNHAVRRLARLLPIGTPFTIR